MKTIGILFTNNLRVQDNTVLAAASSGENLVIPLYFFDTKKALKKSFGMRKIGPYRAKFMCEAVENLQQNIRNFGSELCIIKGESLEVLGDFIVSQHIEILYMQESVGYDEREETQKLKDLLALSGIGLKIFWDHTLVHKDDLPFHISQMPQIFTNFRKQVEKESEIHKTLRKISTLHSPELGTYEGLMLQDFGYESCEIDSRRAIEFRGGEDAALARLKHYLWDTQSLGKYKETRNGLIGADYSSKFSAWLSLGCISARTIYHEIKRYEAEIEKNDSTYWLIFELLWRDFFQFIFAQDPMRFFINYPKTKNILQNETQRRKFESWKQGKLGVPFVDANMRELALTGFMSNRGRQNVASYLIHDLKLDWRLGAMYFESMLIDYDVASNWGNWAYGAGVGNDPRDNRYFNIERQQSMYDSDGAYRKLWKSIK